MFVFYGYCAKVPHLSSQIHSYFCFMSPWKKKKKTTVWGHVHRQEDQRVSDSFVGSWGCECDIHVTFCEFDSQRSLVPCCLSFASGWWLVCWCTLPVSAWCILITRSKQASWSLFQAVQWQPTLCKSSHAKCLFGLSSVLSREIFLKWKKKSPVSVKMPKFWHGIWVPVRLKIVLITID